MRLLLPLFFWLFATGAAAADEQSVVGLKFNSAWMIDGQLMGPGATISGPRTFNGSRAVIQTKLVPEAVFQLDKEFVSPDGKFRLGVGYQLLLQTSDVLMACAIYKLPKGWNPYGKQTVACFIDQNKDKRFDGFFTKKVGVLGFVCIDGKIPESTMPGIDVKYSDADPKLYADRPYYQLAYEGYESFSGKQTFSLAAFSAFGMSNYLQSKKLKFGQSDFNQELVISGATIKILDFDQKTKSMTLDVLKSFERQKFSCDWKV